MEHPNWLGNNSYGDSMKENKRTAAIIGGLLLFATVIAVGVFVLSGSQGVSWFILIGIPVIVVLGIGLYVKGVTSQTGTTTQEFTQSTGQSTADEFQEFLREYHSYKNQYQKFEPQISSKIESISGDFRNEGIEFDIESGSYELNDVNDASIQTFEKISNQISQAKDDLVSNFNIFVQNEIDQIEQSLAQLSEKELLRTAPTFYFETGSSLAEASSELDEARDQASNSIDDAIESIREMGRGDTRASNVQEIDQNLNQAQSAASANQYQRSANAVLEAQDALRQQLSGSFESQHNEIERLISKFNQLDINSYVDAETVSELEQSESTLNDLTDALDLAELTRVRSDVRRSCTDMVAQMYNNVVEHAQTLSNSDIPESYYTRPTIVDEDPVQRLKNIDKLDEYSSMWESIAKRLQESNDILSTKAAVVEAYPDVVDRIEETLQKEGQVTGDDLPMKNTSDFLKLYALKNETVQYDSERFLLHRGEVETHTVSVQVGCEDIGSATQPIKVELEERGYATTTQINGGETQEVIFDDVPEGEHTLHVIPKNGEYQRASGVIRVNEDDTAYNIELQEQQLIDKVCEGVDIDVEEVLSDIQTRIETRFDEEGYVSSEMEFPISSEYMKCVLATWCDNEGYEICEKEGAIIGYNQKKIENEIEKLTRYNLDAGETLAYSEIRKKFISPPLPNAKIKEIIDKIETDKKLSTTESKIEVIN